MFRIALALATALTAAPASADSCWWHNGSLMRLVSSGDWRAFYYETPRQVLRDAGVRPGTLLFEGRKDGQWYEGNARIFSRHCAGDPYEYWVRGPISEGPTVTVEGERDLFDRCAPTGQTRWDRLVFTYAHDC